MINFMLGASGGGKSYESVVFHVLKAVRAGRLVITNLPILREGFEAFDPGDPGKIPFVELLDIREKSRGPQRVDRESGELEDTPVFGHIDDYGATWRSPTGQGPLYVIDECHKALPLVGTSRKVEEWFAEHRHENADVLLITQSYGKISKAIRDNVQIVYRVRKAVAFGLMNKYIRKVQDGLRGEVLNESIRDYEPKYFKLYRSHTKGAAAEELISADIRPLWKNWSFVGAGACFVAVLASCASGTAKSPWSTSRSAASVAPTPGKPSSSPLVALPAAAPASAAAPLPSPPASAAQSAAPAASAASAPVPPAGPYTDKGLHLVGVIRKPGAEVWSIAVSQNGQHLMTTSAAELVKAGYSWTPLGDCAGVLEGYGHKRAIVCDWPVVGLMPQGVAKKEPN